MVAQQLMNLTRIHEVVGLIPGSGSSACCGHVQKKNSRFYRVQFIDFFFLSFCYFFGPLPRHMEVPRLGVKSELQPLA